MKLKHDKLLEEVFTLLDDIANEDETIDDLQKGAEYWCSNWDLCEGYKTAIRICLNDQYNNHPEDQEYNALLKLKKILLGGK